MILVMRRDYLARGHSSVEDCDYFRCRFLRWASSGGAILGAFFLVIILFGSARAQCIDYLELVGGEDTPGTAQGVAVSGNYAFVVDSTGNDGGGGSTEAGLSVFDITDPATPHLVGSLDTPGYAANVFISGGHAYVADNISGLQVIDISNPGSPWIVGSTATPGKGWDVEVSGGFAYVADYTAGLQVVDISNPASPHIVGSINTPGTAYSLALSGSHAYIADGNSGLKVINIANPASPQIVGGLNTLGFSKGVDVSGSLAYVADSDGLQVIDISNPLSPLLVGNVETPGSAISVAVSDGSAFVGDSTRSLLAIDLVNPAIPLITGSVAMSGDVYGVAALGNFVFTAVDNWYVGGLKVVEVCSEPSAVEDGVPVLGPVLFAAYPNPFNPQTTIAFDLSKSTSVTLRIFDISGRLMRVLLDGEVVSEGRRAAVWNGRDDTGRPVASGTYFYRLEAGEYSETRQMALVK